MLNKPSFKFPFLYGFMASICFLILLIFLYIVLNINPLGGKKEVGFVFVIFAMIFSVKAVREANGGAISIRNGYGISFFTNLVFCFFCIIFLYIFLENIAPNALKEYIDTTEAELIKNKTQIIKNGISEQAHSDALKGIKTTNVKSILIDDFLKKIFLSIIPSLMVALYFKRRFV